MTTYTDRQKACPICGSTDISEGEVLTALPNNRTATQSMCRQCGALGPEAILPHGEVDFGCEKASEAWNRRAVAATFSARPLWYVKQVHANHMPEFNSIDEFSDGLGGGTALYALESTSPITGFSEPDADHEFKNFHRALCERFEYVHDEKDWKRDQVSLIEWIAKRVSGEPDGGADVPEEVIREQEPLNHPATQVFFRAGLLACREYMARFVQHESQAIAASIRANWWPSLGQDFGSPRKLEWSELTEGEYGEEGFRAKTADEISPTQEALPIALQFLQSLDPSYRRATIGMEGLERSLERGLNTPSTAAHAGATNSEDDVLTWLETEVTAISCRYHGDPSYDHDAYWMRDRVIELIADARKAFPAPTADRGAITDERGFYVLTDIIRCLRETAEYRDEEGDDTHALEQLVERLSAAPTPVADSGAAEPVEIENARIQDYAEQNMLALEEALDELRAGEVPQNRVAPLPRASDAPSTAAHAGATLTDEQIESAARSYCIHVEGTGYDTLRFECTEDRNNFVRALAAAKPVSVDAPTATAPAALTDEQIIEIASEYQTVVPGNCLYIVEFARALLAAAKPVSVDAHTAAVGDGVTLYVDPLFLEIARQGRMKHIHATAYQEPTGDAKAAVRAKPVSDSVPLEITPNTLGGFRGAFYVTNKRAPTEQEVFDAGVKSGMSRVAKPVSVDAGGMTFEQWATKEGLISESHGVRFVNSMCDVAEKAWQARASMPERKAGGMTDEPK